MKRFFRSIPWKSILLFTLVAALGVGAIVGIGKVVKEDTKTISSLSFERGGLDEDGVYVDTKKSIVTKDLIECQGLRIEPDFEATGKFQVFYYAHDKTFVGSTKLMKAIDGEYEKGDSFGIAKYCRIVITPEAPKDDNGKLEENFEIAFYEVLGFANDYTITVNKKQKFDENGLFKEGKMINTYMEYDSANYAEVVFATRSGYAVSDCIDVTGINKLSLVYPEDSGALVNCIFFDGTIIEGEGLSGGGKVFEYRNLAGLTTLNVPSGATYIQITYKMEFASEIGVFQLS